MKRLTIILALFLSVVALTSSSDNTIQALSEQTFQKQIKKGIVVVDFWATWCGPCRMQAPIFESVAEEMKKKVSFGKVDVDQNKLLSDVYKIYSIPTILIFKNGQLVWRLEGLSNRETLRQTIIDVINKK